LGWEGGKHRFTKGRGKTGQVKIGGGNLVWGLEVRTGGQGQGGGKRKRKNEEGSIHRDSQKEKEDLSSTTKRGRERRWKGAPAPCLLTGIKKKPFTRRQVTAGGVESPVTFGKKRGGCSVYKRRREDENSRRIAPVEKLRASIQKSFFPKKREEIVVGDMLLGLLTWEGREREGGGPGTKKESF